MNMHILGVIIGREYTTRVKKKSFIILTFVVPLLFAALCIVPSIIMVASKDEAKTVAVLDESGIVLPYLEDNDLASFVDCSSMSVDSAKAGYSALGMDILLHISPLDSAAKTLNVWSYSEKPMGVDLETSVEAKVNDAVEDYRIASYGIDNLDVIMDEVKSDIKIRTYRMDESGNESISSSEVYMLVSMVLGIIIYMFIAMFCGTVMSSVIEEKASRVVEVLVSSVKATELLFGKIIGVALVALTQFLMWIVLTLVIVTVVGGIVGFDKIAGSGAAADPAAMMSSMGVSADDLEAAGMGNMATMDVNAIVEETGAEAILSTLADLNYAQIIISFIIFFIFGYLLYASLFAAIGSAVENEADTQQLQIPVTIPLLIGFFIAIYAFKAPDSGLVFWGSMIPFTSPIVMLARIPYGVPMWQLIVSMVLLIGTFGLCAWASAKIYRIGILMFGKKSTFKDLWNWLRQK